MTRSRLSHRNSASYRRRGPERQPTGQAFLIVTEGEKTEPTYLKTLCRCLHLSVADVKIVHPEGTDPKTLVREAIALRNRRKREARKGQTVAYDEVWVVFDLEGLHDERRRLAREARNIRGACGIRFAESDPCFEFWLLLHEKYTTRQFQDCPKLVKYLKRFLPTYSKGQPLPADFLENLPDAIDHAERCRGHHSTCDGDGNPSTRVDKLVRSLNEATRSHFRFQLKGDD